jgi:hypothetical protein
MLFLHQAKDPQPATVSKPLFASKPSTKDAKQKMDELDTKLVAESGMIVRERDTRLYHLSPPYME